MSNRTETPCFSTDELKKQSAAAKRSYELSEKDFRRWERQELEAQETWRKYKDEELQHQQRQQELEKTREQADRALKHCQQHVAYVAKQIEDSVAEQRHGQQAIASANEKLQRARERKDQAAIDHEQAKKRQRVLQEFAVARAEHDTAKEHERVYQEKTRAKQQEMAAMVKEYWNMAHQMAEGPTDDECAGSETARQQQPASTARSRHHRDRSQTTAKQFHRLHHERLKLTPAPKAKPPIRGSAGRRDNSETPQSRMTSGEVARQRDFYAWMATTTVYEGVCRSELARWLDRSGAHIICVHFIGQGAILKELCRLVKKVVEATGGFQMCSAGMTPIALIYKKDFNKVTCPYKKMWDTLSAAVFEIQRRVDGRWVAPYAVGVVHAPVVFCLSANDFNEAMTYFQEDKVSFVSAHGITTRQVRCLKAEFLLCNEMCREYYANTAVADTPSWGNGQWVVIPHCLLVLAAKVGNPPKLLKGDESDTMDPTFIKGDGSIVIHQLQTIESAGPVVTFADGVRVVDLNDDESRRAAPEGRELVRYISHVFQPKPIVYKSIHWIMACFGKSSAVRR